MPPAEFNIHHMKCVPEFDGDTQSLSRFLATCKIIVDQYYSVQNENLFQNRLIINCLLQKLTGNAKIIANTTQITKWQEFKDVLVRNFADSRNEENLLIDLTSMRQKQNETAQSFYERCLNQLGSMNTHADLHEANAAAKELKYLQYKKLTLSIYLNGLFEPLRTNILNMRPTSLAEAYQFITERENNDKIFNRNRVQNLNPNKKPQNNNNQNTQKTIYVPIRYAQNNNQNFSRSNNFPQTSNNQQRVFQSNKPPTNVFAPKNTPTHLLPKPTPMSGISTNNTNRQNQMYTVETDENPQILDFSNVETENYQEITVEENDQNFQELVVTDNPE